MSALALAVECTSGGASDERLAPAGGGEEATADADDGGVAPRVAPEPPRPADAAGAADIEAAAPEGPALRYVGRFDRTDPAGAWVAWPGARVLARFRGSTIKVRLREVPRKGSSYYDVLVDGVVRATPLAPRPGGGEYTVASDLPPGEHVVELYRRTEARVGLTRIDAVEVPGGELLAPPPAPERRIEFLGDSTTTGFGNLGDGPDCPFSSDTQNERLAFSGLVARDLGADHHDTAYSGKGVIWNYDRSDPVVFEDVLPRVLPDAPEPLWDFTTFIPHVVWIMLGGNDWDRPSPGDPPPDRSRFAAAYQRLVERLRRQYPEAHLFLALAPSLTDAYPAGYAAYSSNRETLLGVVEARAAAGDMRVRYFEFSRAARHELTGCFFHAGLALHRRMADEALAAIREVTGWR